MCLIYISHSCRLPVRPVIPTNCSSSSHVNFIIVAHSGTRYLLQISCSMGQFTKETTDLPSERIGVIPYSLVHPHFSGLCSKREKIESIPTSPGTTTPLVLPVGGLQRPSRTHFLFSFWELVGLGRTTLYM